LRTFFVGGVVRKEEDSTASYTSDNTSATSKPLMIAVQLKRFIPLQRGDHVPYVKFVGNTQNRLRGGVSMTLKNVTTNNGGPYTAAFTGYDSNDNALYARGKCVKVAISVNGGLAADKYSFPACPSPTDVSYSSGPGASFDPVAVPSRFVGPQYYSSTGRQLFGTVVELVLNKVRYFSATNSRIESVDAVVTLEETIYDTCVPKTLSPDSCS
jgi:hypothetical protein